MPQPNPRFALNHIIAPRLGPEAFFALAGALGIGAVEIRNDIPGTAILVVSLAFNLVGDGLRDVLDPRSE